MDYPSEYGHIPGAESSALMVPPQVNGALSARARDLARIAGCTVAELWLCAGPEAQADVCDTLGYGWHITGALGPAEAMEAISEGWGSATVSQILSILSILGVNDG